MTDSDLQARLARLEAVEDIKKLKARYFRYVDLHWWAELRTLFTDDAEFDIGESTSQPSTPDEFIASIDRHLSDAMTVHHGHMPEIDILDDDHVRGTWAMYDLVEPPPGGRFPALTGFGHYCEEYRRVDGLWRISRLRLTRLRRSVDGVVVEGSNVDGRRPFPEKP